MCGIAGAWGKLRQPAELARRMTAALLHRGPDDEGVWGDPEAGIGLGHRRLAIVDLSSAGHEPMHSHSGRFVITFNGEIFNHADIRRELEAKGQAPETGWRGHSDVEVLLQAMDSWGVVQAIERSVGQFAFGLWDRKDRKLTLVRDRFGEKPLYYGWVGRDLVFASELKAIRSHPEFNAAVDRRALGLFAARTYIPAPLSIYRGIFKLEPGCMLELAAGHEPQGEAPVPGTRERGLSYARYWSYRDVMRTGLADPLRSEAEALEKLEQVLLQAVRDQSMADVPVGAFLSGGIDSSALVALYKRVSSQRVRTFTISFKEEAFDEAPYARAVAAHFGTEHHEHVVTAREARDVIPRLPDIYDEPFADSSQIPTFLVSKAAREKVTVALSGDGGDELFGGYNRYFGTARLWSHLKRMPRLLRAAAAATAGAVPVTAWDGLGRTVLRGRMPNSFGIKMRKSLRTIGSARGLEDLHSAFIDEWAEEGSPVVGGGAGPESCALDLALGEGAPDALRMMYCDTVSYLPGDILCKVDRASMAVSLETRAPYLDHRVAELAARIPVDMNIDRGSGKRTLKTLLYREAPKALFERPKTGFAVPVGEWIRGPLRPWAEELLDYGAIRAQGWLDPEAVSRRWRDHLDGTRDSTPALWGMLMFQAWLKRQELPAAKAA